MRLLFVIIFLAITASNGSFLLIGLTQSEWNPALLVLNAMGTALGLIGLFEVIND